MERETETSRAVVSPIDPYTVMCQPAGASTYLAPPYAPRVTVVVPTLNEAGGLRHILPLIPEVYEILVVDGRSTDDTIAVALSMRPEVRVITQPGRGKGDALRHGFHQARGDIIVAIDADGSTDPREIPAFVGALLAGADYVKGSRFASGGGTSDMTQIRKAGNWGFVVLVRLLFGKRYTDFNYGYTAFWKEVLPVLDLQSQGFEIECEMNLRAAITKLKVVEVASFEKLRVAGEAHLKPIPDGWRVLKELVHQWRRRDARPVEPPCERPHLVPEVHPGSIVGDLSPE